MIRVWRVFATSPIEITQEIAVRREREARYEAGVDSHREIWRLNGKSDSELREMEQWYRAFNRSPEA